MEQHFLQGFIKRAAERGLSPRQTGVLLKQSNLLSRLGWGAAGAGSVLGGLALKDAVEDVTKSESQLALERLLENTQGMSSDVADAHIANYLKNLMQRRHDEAKSIYNL